MRDDHHTRLGRNLKGGLLLFALLLAAHAAPGLCQGLKATGPLIELGPAAHDLGTMPQETIRKLTSRIYNRGTSDLIISSVESDCGCTVAALPDSCLAPGDSTSLGITFSTRHFSGNVTKNVFLKTNDPGSPRARIKVRAFVHAIVAIDPDELQFGSVPRGESPRQVVEFKALPEDTLRILAVTVPEELFTYELEQLARTDSTIYELTLAVKPGAPPGAFNANARIRTNIKSYDELTINLLGQIHGFFSIDPPSFSLGQILEGRERHRMVKLEAMQAGFHEVLGAECSDARLKVRIVTVEEGRRYEVVVGVPDDMPPGEIKATLRIKTDDPGQPEIPVRIKGRIRKARGNK